MHGTYFILYKTGPMLTVHMYLEKTQAILLCPLHICLKTGLLLLPYSQEVVSRMLFSCKGFRAKKGGYGKFGDGNTHPHLVRKNIRRNF